MLLPLCLEKYNNWEPNRKTFGDTYVQLPDDIIVEQRQDSSKNANKISSKDNPIDNLIEKVFPKLKENCTSADYMRERAILSTTMSMPMQ